MSHRRCYRCVTQVLPLVPPARPIEGIEAYWSPYSGEDANAGNTLLISLEALVEDGLLKASDLPEPCKSSPGGSSRTPPRPPPGPPRPPADPSQAGRTVRVPLVAAPPS